MALELDKCITEYIRASVLLIPRQKFIELRDDMQEQLKDLNESKPPPSPEIVEKILARIEVKNHDDFNKEIDEITDVKLIIDDIPTGIYRDRIAKEIKEIADSIRIDKIKQAVKSHPLKDLTDDQIKKYFGRQEYLLSDSNSFDSFGSAIYQLLTENYQSATRPFAEVECGTETDQAFWAWMNAVNSHLGLQKVAAKAFKQWLEDASSPNKDALIDALGKFQESNLTPVPSNLKGKII